MSHTIHTLAAEYDLTPAEAWSQLDGFAATIDGDTPLSPGSESLARVLLEGNPS